MAGPAPKLPRRLNFSGERDQPALAVRITEFQDDVIEYLRVLDLPTALREIEELVEGGGGGSEDDAQDAVGNILADSDTIDFTYDAVTPAITAEVKDDSITNEKLANVPTATFKGRTSASTGSPEDLSATQATALLNVAEGDSGSGGAKGLVPAPAAGDAAAGKVLRADMTWAAPTTAPVWVPDAPPLSPSAYDDEFNGASLNAKWGTWDVAAYMTKTVDTTRQMLKMSATGNGGQRWAGIYQAAPASAYAIYAKVALFGPVTNYSLGGIFVSRDIVGSPSTAGLNFLGQLYQGAAPNTAGLGQAYTSYNGGASGAVFSAGQYSYYRLRWDGSSSLFYDLSIDGVSWVTVGSGAIGYVPSYFGLAINAQANTATAIVLVDFFRVVAGAGTAGQDATYIGRMLG